MVDVTEVFIIELSLISESNLKVRPSKGLFVLSSIDDLEKFPCVVCFFFFWVHLFHCLIELGECYFPTHTSIDGYKLLFGFGDKFMVCERQQFT